MSTTRNPICFQVQEGIDRSLLQSFIDMRAEDTKKPMTQRAVDMLIRKLSRLEAQGHCPNLLLERSIIGTYQDVYPDDSTRKHVAGSFAAIHTDRSWAGLSFTEQHTDQSWRNVSFIDKYKDKSWCKDL